MAVALHEACTCRETSSHLLFHWQLLVVAHLLVVPLFPSDNYYQDRGTHIVITSRQRGFTSHVVHETLTTDLYFILGNYAGNNGGNTFPRGSMGVNISAVRVNPR